MLSPQISLFVQPRSWRPRLSNSSPCVFGLGARLVDVLQRLERQHRSADVARLAVPDQLDFALVLEQDEAVFLRQGFALLDQGDQVALFGVGQVVRASSLGVPCSSLLVFAKSAGKPGE